MAHHDSPRLSLLSSFGLVLLLATGATACSDPSGELDTGEATEADSADGPAGSEGADGSDPDEGADPDDGVDPDDGAGSGGADEGGGSDHDPAECDEPDGISASFDVDDHDWPQAEEFQIDVDVDCEIVDMGSADGVSITPTLECDDDGTMRTVAITMNDPGFTTPDDHPLLPGFDVGQPVRFRHRGVQDAGGIVDGADPLPSHYLLESFSLHSPEGRLLAAGFRDWGMDSDLYAPIQITEDDTFCGEPLPFPDDPERPMLLTFQLEDGSLSLVGGHAGLLDPEGFGDSGIAIVAASAQTGGCCHTNRQYAVLMLSLTQGEG